MNPSFARIRDEAKKIKEQEKALGALRVELKEAFGPTFDTDGSILLLVREANALLDEPSFRETPPFVKPSITLALVEHSSPSVRLFVARTLPVQYVDKLANDPDRSVRLAVAWRTTPRKLDEMRRRNPADDQLKEIARQRGFLVESTRSVVKGLDPAEPKKKLGKAGKQWEGSELSDTWYDTQANKLIKMYQNNLEYCWEEVACRRLVSSMRATSHVDIDEKKLYDVLKKKIKEREDWRLKALDDDPLQEQPLKETLDWLNRGSHPLYIPVLDEEEDVVQKLVDSRCSSQEYIRQFNTVFGVSESQVPRSVGKYHLGESRGSMRVPVKAHLPTRKALRAIDERALDRYVTAWNEVHARDTHHEPIRISWTPALLEQDVINFDVILK
jgi:hypothetical protein